METDDKTFSVPEVAKVKRKSTPGELAATAAFAKPLLPRTEAGTADTEEG